MEWRFRRTNSLPKGNTTLTVRACEQSLRRSSRTCKIKRRGEHSLPAPKTREKVYFCPEPEPEPVVAAWGLRRAK